MLDTLQSYAAMLAILLNGIALGAAWIVTMASPNLSFDRLDGSRADGYVRALLKGTSTPLAGLLLAAGAFGVLGGTYAASACSLLAAFGFFSNHWMLASRGKVPKQIKTSRKGQRVMAVSMSLVFSLVVLAACLLGIAGI